MYKNMTKSIMFFVGDQTAAVNFEKKFTSLDLLGLAESHHGFITIFQKRHGPTKDQTFNIHTSEVVFFYI